METYRTLLAIGYTLLLLDLFSIILYRSEAVLFPQIIVLILSLLIIIYAIVQIKHLR
ncbi:hypothetical protein [Saccharolobus caldissimus]|uniref:hypothetical protein n=1 Tax=Saccharolobus caldissimus TaxID=1702097 RepID=UPI001E57ED20|nr:hypothetical protein [Saccharolobus caldissimus]